VAAYPKEEIFKEPNFVTSTEEEWGLIVFGGIDGCEGTILGRREIGCPQWLSN
jgi:hypothetical protein